MPFTRREQYERQIKRIERMEAAFVRSGRRLMRDRFREFVRFLKEGYIGETPQVLDLLAIPTFKSEMRPLIDEHVLNMWVEGAVSGRRELKGSDTSPEGLSVTELMIRPRAAIDWVLKRSGLNRFFDADLSEKIRESVVEILEKGYGLKKAVQLLKNSFAQFSGPRLETIAQNESIAAYNNGRLAMFMADPGFVRAVRFLAIVDTRTTEICKTRNELILGIRSPLIGRNTPSLHHRCRSLWSPVTKLEARRLIKAGGFLTEQEWLNHEQARWLGVPPPAPGFGFSEVPGPATGDTLRLSLGPP